MKLLGCNRQVHLASKSAVPSPVSCFLCLVAVTCAPDLNLSLPGGAPAGNYKQEYPKTKDEKRFVKEWKYRQVRTTRARRNGGPGGAGQPGGPGKQTINISISNICFRTS